MHNIYVTGLMTNHSDIDESDRCGKILDRNKSANLPKSNSPHESSLGSYLLYIIAISFNGHTHFPIMFSELSTNKNKFADSRTGVLINHGLCMRCQKSENPF